MDKPNKEWIIQTKNGQTKQTMGSNIKTKSEFKTMFG